MNNLISKELKQCMREGYIKEGYWKSKTYGEILEELAQKFSNRVALTDGKQYITYEELNHFAYIGSHFFYQKGLRCGDRVIVQLLNSILFFKVIFSLFRLGVVPIFALPAHREKEIKSFINVASPKAYIICRNHLGYNYTAMAEECVEETDCELYFSDILENNFEHFDHCFFNDLPEVDPYDTAVLLVSGGTTGVPKLIPRTHADYLYNSKIFAEKCFWGKDTIFLAAIPVAHNFAFANPGVMGTLLQGGKAVLSANGSPDEIFFLIEKEKVNITSMVPSLMISQCFRCSF